MRIKFYLKAILVVVLLLFLNGCSEEKMYLSEEIEAQVKREIEEMFSGLVDASNETSPVRYFEYFDKKRFSGLNADGTNWNSFDDFKLFIAPSFSMVEKVQILKFTNVHISVIDPRTAILVNEYEQTILLKNGSTVFDAGGGTQVWSKAGGSWKLVSVSASTKTNEANK